MHRPRVSRNRFGDHWQVVCLECNAAGRLWCHGFDTWREAYTYARRHVSMAAMFGAYSSPARWVEWGGA